MEFVAAKGAVIIRSISSVSGSKSGLEENTEEGSEEYSQEGSEQGSEKDTKRDNDTHASLYQESLAMHRRLGGVLEVASKVHLRTLHDLSVAYTPGVAEPCRKISENPNLVYLYTLKKNTVAVVTDGSAVLGLGNIGPYAALPVMEGKALIFKEFAGIDAFPICLDTQDTEEVIKAKKELGELKTVISGLGAAGVAVFQIPCPGRSRSCKNPHLRQPGNCLRRARKGHEPCKRRNCQDYEPRKVERRAQRSFPGS